MRSFDDSSIDEFDDDVFDQPPPPKLNLFSRLLQERRKLIIGGVVVLVLGLIAAGVLVGGYFIANASSNSTSGLWSNYKLPTFATPSAYEIRLEPDLTTFKFDGKIKIHVTVAQATQYLVLHQADLKINSAVITGSSPDSATTTAKILTNDDLEYLYLKFPSSLEPGKYELSMNFTGILNDEMRGFYRSTYTGTDGTTKFIGTTQFESTDARRAFPCFDQPDFKAKFQITLVVPSGLTVLSNTMVEKQESMGIKEIVTFRQTPEMSTYLVAFIVGEFEYVEDVDSKGKPIRVYTVQGKKEQGRFALEVAKGALAWYEEFFDYEYQLPKLDMIAIPDFAAGAMENWGLVTYRETALLLDESVDAAANRQRVATVVTHELAHQWTGNLVTCAWWGDLWLNEGFADFFETESANALFPAWHMRDQFLVEDQQRALEIDALNTSHPLSNTVGSADQISEMFDGITYSKGGSVIRMMADYLTMDVFKRGMRAYMKQFAFKNAQAEDLIQALSTAAGKDLTPLMGPWVRKSGFPVVQVSSSEPGKLTLHQVQMEPRTSSSTVPPSNIWWVPVNIASSATTTRAELSTAQASFAVDASASYYKINFGQNGFYRAMYSTPLLNQLDMALSRGEIRDPVDRAGIINDALVLARAGYLPTSVALGISKHLHDEQEYVVWSSALTELARVSVLMTNDYCYGDLRKFMQYILKNAVDFVGWEAAGSTHLQGLLRSSILSTAVAFQYRPVVDEAVRRFQSFIATKTPVPGDLRAAVYRAGVAQGGDDAYHALLDYYMQSNNAADKTQMLYALGRARDVHLLRHTLEISIDTSIVRSQDRVAAISGVSANPLGRDLAWNFVRENWDDFNSRGFAIANLIRIVTAPFSDKQHLQDVKDFFAAHMANGGERTVQQSIETIQANIHWREANAQDVCGWLANNTN